MRRDVCGGDSCADSLSEKRKGVNGYEDAYELGPGEIVRITPVKIEPLVPAGDKMKICAFLWAYYGYPNSNYEGINVEVMRCRNGEIMAREEQKAGTMPDMDYIAGVPDSGLAHAIGYSMESGIPFRRPLVKYTPTYGRSYAPPSQHLRDLTARMKLIAIKDVIEGNSLILLEDSIVRGTQLKNFTVEKLWNCGAKEIHVRPACPPLMFPCSYCNSTRTNSELITRRAIREIEGHDIDDVSEYLDPTTEKYAKMIEWIRKYLKKIILTASGLIQCHFLLYNER